MILFYMVAIFTWTVEVLSCFWKSIWKAKVPLKVAFFTWTVALVKILRFDSVS